MAGIEQVLNYVKNITETLNQWAANAKKTEELPAMETMDPDGLLMVSHLDNGVWKSKKLEIQKIIDGISLSGQNNNVREVLLGTITATQNLNYLLDNNGITVTEDEIIVLTALTTINATLVQKQYLWKLGKGEYNPIGSANIATKMLELQPRLLNEIISDELTSSPSAVVYDLGVISNTVLENINNANPAYNFTDDEKIYYIRYIKNDVKILYNFIGINNNYGLDQSQMTQADLVLVYSSANSDPTELLNTKLDKGGYSGSAMTLHQEVTSLDQDLNTKIDDFKNQLEQVELPLKADKSETYTKSEIDNKISSVYKYKGSVANYSSLPITNQVIGDVWNVIDTDKNYAWSGTVWDDLGGIGDISGKEDKTQKGAPSGYAPLDEFTKLAAQYLNIVNDLVTGGATALLSAEQGKVLQTQVSAINTLLTSDNVNLDTVQELVDAIETVQLSLNTILVNDLTTGGTTKALTAEMGKLLQTNKVDKVAGERLINAAEITKLAGLSNVVTTVKTILSTALATQDIAGFVTYINTLAVPLVVGANEIVEYKTSDTGRVFKLLLRGRSFGVGQPAIVAADVIETTEFLNKNIRLSNYPSTRNDGQLPTNKVLAPDVNGNLKLYTIATAPAPYMEVLIPDSTLPNNTGNFILKGSFFTPNMTVVLQGQTINYKTFISDNEVRVNVTTGSAEGYFDVVLNNGISATFSKALYIVLGTVYKPNASTWTNKTINADTSEEGSLNVGVYGSQDSAIWNQVFDITKKFRFSFNAFLTPFSSVKLNNSAWIILKDLSGNEKYKIVVHDIYFYFYENGSASNWTLWSSYGKNIELRWVSGVLYFYADGGLIYTSTLVFTENLKLTATVKYYDLKNIRYVELAN